MANNTILIKRTSVSGRTPNTTSSGNTQYIQAGELAFNLTDKKLFSSNGSVLFEIGSNLSNLSVTSNTNVNKLIISGPLYANGSLGGPTQSLHSNGSGVFWKVPDSAAGATYVTQTYYGDGTTNTFTVDTGYTPEFLNVFLNGIRMTGAEANISSGSTVGFASPPPANSNIEVVGFLANTILAVANQSYAYTWLNNHVFSANVTFNAGVIANGSIGSSGQVLVSNGSSVYWGTGTTGTNTQVQFNDSGVANASAGFTFNKAANNLFVGNSVFATVVNAASHTVGTSTVANASGLYATVVNAATFSVGTSLTANSTKLVLGTTVGFQANGSLGSAGQVLVSNGTTVYWGTGTTGSNTQIQFNDSGVANASAGFTFDKVSNTLAVGNTVSVGGQLSVTANATFGSKLLVNNDIVISRPGRVAWVDSDGSSNAMYLERATAFGENVIEISAANNTTNFLRYGNPGLTVFSSNGNTNLTVGNTSVNTVVNSTSVSVANVYATTVNGAALTVGTSTVANSTGVYTGVVNGSSVTVGSNFKANTTQVTIGSGVALSANGSTGSTGQVLVSNGSSVYWGTGTTGTNTQVQFNDSGVANASAGFTFNKVSNTLFVGNTVDATTFTGTANNTNYVGSVSAANVVSNAQLSSNLANYQTTAGLSANVATLIANNTSFVGSVSAANVVSNAQLSSNLANYALLSGATFTGDIVANNANTIYDLNIGRNLYVSGNLTIGSNVNIIGANNLSVIDNMIYLNSNSTWANPDIGIAANYNDGTYHHTGIFRDHNDGYWKVFDNYLPEPDANIYIQTTNTTFHLANFQANTFLAGNTSSSWAVVNTSGVYTSGLVNATTVNVSSLIVGTSTIANSTGVYTGVVNGSSITVGTSFIANSTGAYHTGPVNASSFSVGSATIANSSGVYAAIINASSGIYGTLQTTSQPNITANNTSFVGSVSAANVVSNAQLTSNLANYQTTAGLSANVATLTSNNTLYLGGVAAASYVQNTDSRTLSGNLVFSGANINFTGTKVTISTLLSVNTLNLDTALAAIYGGTGQNSYSVGDVLYANSSTSLAKLSVGSNGQVLQIVNNLPAYDILDGGTY
jgi:hypothetical protein